MTTDGFPDVAYVQARIDDALEEDGAHDDRKIEFLGIKDKTATGRIVARGEAVIAGLDVARMTFVRRDGTIRFAGKVKDGDRVRPGAIIGEIEGPAGTILSAERVALNFLQRLSGVATLTARFVDKVRGTGVRILDTRKTTPSLRRLERYAVRVGGGANHRFNLGDMILIKENHIRVCGGIGAVRQLLSGKSADMVTEIEVDSIACLKTLLGTRADRIMLDNFEPTEIREALADIGGYRAKHPEFMPKIEVSGGIDLANVAQYAIDGVDDISIGALTHSAPATDISLEVDP
jgi:nicotinate-nucleotide pyrophosphorylase (carboxylating)